MSLHVNIRKAVLKDSETIAHHNTLLAKETENKDLEWDTALKGVKAVIKDPHKGFYLVAEAKGETAGQLMVTTEWSDWRNMMFWWIQSVYVPEKWRKQGVYRSLYHHLEQIARYKKEVAGLRLYVEHNNQTAMDTYERLGMVNPDYVMYEIIL